MFYFHRLEKRTV